MDLHGGGVSHCAKSGMQTNT